ncbi:MAG: hypothetical protein AAB402_03455 [Patescibacteria group bacterium]
MTARKIRFGHLLRVFVIGGIFALFLIDRSPASAATTSTLVSNTTRSGTITKNETWSGTISVTGSITVPKKVTLTIRPGTTVKIKPSRDYKKPCGLSYRR